MAEATGRSVVVETTSGPVRGFARQGSVAFLGIPYAEPPFGARRFLRPQPREPWSEIRDATRYGPTPQRVAFAEITAIPEPSIAGADTLTVNVFTPSPVPAAAPVLVYIHGGGYVAGSPASPWYDGASFNRDGVVVVTFGYRLGFDGFGWLPDAPTNRAVHDWLLALHWVHENIARFGGDPARITLAGQSAGGGAVLTLLTLPAARGLFQRAFVQSAASACQTLSEAEWTTRRLAERLGVTPDRAGLAAVHEGDLIEAQIAPPTARATDQDSVLELVASLTTGGVTSYAPVVDGELIPVSVEEALRCGGGGATPVMIGSTREEFSTIARSHRTVLDSADPVSAVMRLGVPAPAARQYIDVSRGMTTSEVVGRYLTDMIFRRHVIDWAAHREERANTWVYDFAWRSRADGLAGHCLDVPFVFDVLEEPSVERLTGPHPPQELADEIHGAVVRFVSGSGPGWEPWRSNESVRVFDRPSHEDRESYASAAVLRAAVVDSVGR